MMQATQAMQTTGKKRFTYTHLGIMALVLSLVVSTVTAVTTLGITGDLPGQQHSTVSAPAYIQDNALLEHTAMLKEARQEAVELEAGQTYGWALMIDAQQRYFELKEARQEAVELEAGKLYVSAVSTTVTK